jgi:hypothetical protein
MDQVLRALVLVLDLGGHAKGSFGGSEHAYNKIIVTNISYK